jgi:signal transduction histidine kinase
LATAKYDKQIEDLKKQHEAELKQLNNKLVDTEKSVNKRINQELQKMGVSTFLLEIPVEVKSAKEAYKQFLAMPNGSAKTEFFNKNEKLIREGMSVSP